MMITESFITLLHQRLSLSHLISRYVRLTRQGHNYKGLCPFHAEKTPSFTVNDSKNFYHCFGCQAHGDAIAFLQHMERLTFKEAVARLAQEVGLTLETSAPEPDFKPLYQALEKACQWFQDRLHSPEGEAARVYLASRGLTSAEIKHFRLGWAPARGLSSLNISQPILEQAGLVVRPPTGGPGYDRFRERITFPILNSRDQVIAFGARILGTSRPDIPKYLNSPEMPLFSKGRTLYGSPHRYQNPQPCVLVEGYLDVIALQRHCLAVAPLGTAITLEQIEKIWKHAPMPVVCLDGDTAGQKASIQLAIKVLPILRPGYTLSFAQLPAGEDPHSLLQAQGWPQMARYIDQALPLAEVLWREVRCQFDWTIPEHRAAALHQWQEWVKTIVHPQVKEAYRQFAWQKLKAGPKPSASLPPPSQSLPQQILVAMPLLFPDLLLEVQEQLSQLIFPAESPWQILQQRLLDWCAQRGEADFTSFFQDQNPVLLKERLQEIRRHIPTELRQEAPVAALKDYWIALFNDYQTALYRQEELQFLQHKIEHDPTPQDWERLQHLRTVYT